MSKEINQETMDRLAGSGSQHLIIENPNPDVLLSGTVNIGKTNSDLAKAEALGLAVSRAIAAIKAIMPMVAVAAFMAVMTSSSFAQSRDASWSPRPAAERGYKMIDVAKLGELQKVFLSIKGTRVEIFCSGLYCKGISEDLDEVFESAGHDSYLELPMFDVGKGAGISPDNTETRKIADAIRKATSGDLVLREFDGAKPTENKIIIVIGRKKP